eukprot:TRINITY_DN2891_c0_g1_i1.p1 TRINITY_DN2891_c0_g1~~TRINITY_DN2891_c0_g1_i1.p1  ORF type:complete len:145 (+),score=22.35 TRINITY_DN2891_c0_g1_i1:495-929(+)
MKECDAALRKEKECFTKLCSRYKIMGISPREEILEKVSDALRKLVQISKSMNSEHVEKSLDLYRNFSVFTTNSCEIVAEHTPGRLETLHSVMEDARRLENKESVEMSDEEISLYPLLKDETRRCFVKELSEFVWFPVTILHRFF